MKHFIPSVLFFFLGINTLFSQTNFYQSKQVSPVKESFHSFTSIPSHILFEPGKELLISDLNTWLSSFFEDNTPVSFQLISQFKDHLGISHFRFQQFVNNTPVEHGDYVVHAKNDKIISMNGLCFDHFSSSNQASLSENQAFNIALKDVNASYYSWQHAPSDAKRSILDPSDLEYPKAQLVYAFQSNKPNEALVLAYKFIIYALEPFSKQHVFVDANEGKVIRKENLLHAANVSATAKTVFSGNQTIITQKTDSAYILRDYTRGNGIETFNLKKSSDTTKYIDFTDFDNVWDSANANLDQYALDVHWGAEATYDYYLNKHNRNSIDNQGFKLRNMVHYGQNFVNAFWDGSKMIFGDGNATIGPLVSLDIIGHEITHGLTAKTANLVLENESGALNESFSDIFGVTIDWHTRPQKANWTLAEEVSTMIRSMENPSVNNDPDTYMGINWKTIGGADDGGIHSNSGVQNFWYYLLAKGGSGTNDIGNQYNVNGIGLDKAAQIAYRNLTVYLTSLSDFKEARFYAIQSAIDLFGSCSQEVEATTNAWHAVGIGEPYVNGIKANFSASCSQTCSSPFLVRFSNNSTNANYFVWDFGDGNTSSEYHPNYLYKNKGNYAVKLIARGDSACGLADTLQLNDFIRIEEPFLPQADTAVWCKNSNNAITSQGQGIIKWFDSKTGGNMIDTGMTIEANILSDTSFFIEDNYYRVGETNVGSTGAYNFDVRHQVFDVFKPLVIKSVLVNSFLASNRIIQLRDNKGKILISDTVFINKGIDTVELNFKVDPGTDYQLGVSGSNISLGRSNINVKYPYSIPDVISIKRSNAKSSLGSGSALSFYYFFYNWEIKVLDCLAERKEIKVKVENCTSVEKIAASATKGLIYDPINGNLKIMPLYSKEPALLSIYNTLGACLFTEPIESLSAEKNVSLAHLASGIYLIELKALNYNATLKMAK